jgi:D-alanine-D-alanine ligase
VLQALLNSRGVDAHPFDPAAPELVAGCRRSGYDRAWIALHGRGGEDGTLQGALEFLGLPYTGSGVLGSAIGMDKLRTKRLRRARSAVDTADCRAAQRARRPRLKRLEQLGLPLIVKPATQGSSVGMSKVERAADMAGRGLAAAARTTARCSPRNGSPAPSTPSPSCTAQRCRSIRIETDGVFYDYQAKYFVTTPVTSAPAGLPAAEAHLASEGAGLHSPQSAPRAGAAWTS